MDSFHLNQIKKEIKKKYGEMYEEEQMENKKQEKLKIVYNDQFLQKKRKKELGDLKNEKNNWFLFMPLKKKSKKNKESNR